MKKMCVQESLEGTYFEENIKTSLVLYSYFLGSFIPGLLKVCWWGALVEWVGGRKRERSKKAAPVVEAA